MVIKTQPKPAFLKRIVESTYDVAFFQYKSLTPEEYSQFEILDPASKLGDPKEKAEYFGLRDKIHINQKLAQRLQGDWKPTFEEEYLVDFHEGFDHIDAFVLVCIKKMIEVLTKSRRKVKNPIKIDEFIKELEDEKLLGKEWVLINGQHRDNIFGKLWNDKIKFPKNFPTLDGDLVGGKFWSELQLEKRLKYLYHTEHPITFVTEFEEMTDLKKLIVLHNVGNPWNAHEQRVIEPSYIMQEFQKLDDNETLKTLFSTGLKSGGVYDVKKKGISFNASQFYMMWSRPDQDWYKLPSVASTDLDELAKIDSTLWTNSSVDNFVKFFKQISYELYENYYKKVIGKKGAQQLLRRKMSSLRAYFLFRLILTGKTPINDIKYSIQNVVKLVEWFTLSESQRLHEREQLDAEGKKKYDELLSKSKGKELDSKEVKALKTKYKKSSAYVELARGGDNQNHQMASMIWEDFQRDYNKPGKLLGVVTKTGNDVSSTMKSIVKTDAIKKAWDSGKSFDEILNIADGDITHENTPKSKGGRDSYDNLGVGDSTENKELGNRH